MRDDIGSPINGECMIVISVVDGAIVTAPLVQLRVDRLLPALDGMSVMERSVAGVFAIINDLQDVDFGGLIKIT